MTLKLSLSLSLSLALSLSLSLSHTHTHTHYIQVTTLKRIGEHPNIVRSLGVFRYKSGAEAEEQQCLVLEYCLHWLLGDWLALQHRYASPSRSLLPLK